LNAFTLLHLFLLELFDFYLVPKVFDLIFNKERK